MPHCTFRVLNGIIWERKGALGNGKGGKMGDQKICKRPVLILGVQMSRAVGRGPKKRPKSKFAIVFFCFAGAVGQGNAGNPPISTALRVDRGAWNLREARIY